MMMSVLLVVTGLLFSALGLYVKDNYLLFVEKVQSSAPAAKRPASRIEAAKATFKVPYRYNIVTGPAGFFIHDHR